VDFTAQPTSASSTHKARTMTDRDTIEAAEALLEHPRLSQPTTPEDQRLATELHRWPSHQPKADLQLNCCKP